MYAPYLLFRLAYLLSRHFSSQRLLPIPCAYKLIPLNSSTSSPRPPHSSLSLVQVPLSITPCSGFPHWISAPDI